MGTMKKVIITGAAGFIGASLAKVLLQQKVAVVGIDNFAPGYDPKLKRARVAMLGENENFTFRRADMASAATLKELLAKDEDADFLVHLAALAGVRQSFDYPSRYTRANIDGFINALEFSRLAAARLVYASSSSVYGNGKNGATLPLSYYGATKLADEIIADTWCRRYEIEATGLRFCTVYGPWGRPDMAAFIFADKILRDKKVELFAYGKVRRDFTYIDDLIDGITKLMKKPPLEKTAGSHRVYDLGSGKNISISAFLKIIEKALGKKARVELLPPNPSESMTSLAASREARRDFDYDPRHSCYEGLPKAIAWYQDFYRR